MNTNEALYAEAQAVQAVRGLIAELEQTAPESMLLHGLREAVRIAHPAATDPATLKRLQAEARERRGLAEARERRDDSGSPSRDAQRLRPLSPPASDE